MYGGEFTYLLRLLRTIDLPNISHIDFNPGNVYSIVYNDLTCRKCANLSELLRTLEVNPKYVELFLATNCE